MMKGLFLAGAIAAFAARAVAAKPDLPIVDLGYERHQAISLNEDTGLYNFSNIRYAQNPVGPLRFSAPQPPTGRLEDVQIGEKGRICPQSAPEWTLVSAQFSEAVANGHAELFNMTEAVEIAKQQIAEGALPSPHADGSTYITEDCLFLDVIVPSAVFDKGKSKNKIHPAKRAPVVVWFHGGGFVRGNKVYGNSCDPSRLITTSQEDGSDGIVYVAVGYRLGALGWLAGSNLQDAGGSSNAGLLDQRLALEWVQENIHLFGGDPDQVTVMGQSAGGGSIVHHITSYGGWVPVTTDQQQVDTAKHFLDYLNVTTIQEAQEASTESVISANAMAIRGAPWSTFRFGPVVDGIYVTDHPSISLHDGDFPPDISVMTGHVTDEASVFTPPFVKTNEDLTDFLNGLYPTAEDGVVDYMVDKLYPDPGINRTMNILSDIGFVCNVNYLRKAFYGQTYNYKFRIPPAIHSGDLAYVFYHGPDLDEVDDGIYDGPLGPVIVEIALVLQKYVVNFIKYGDPNGRGHGRGHGRGLPPFPRADENTTMLTIDTDGMGVAKDDTDNERCEWLQSVPYG